jgi:hypothetical protein
MSPLEYHRPAKHVRTARGPSQCAGSVVASHLAFSLGGGLIVPPRLFGRTTMNWAFSTHSMREYERGTVYNIVTTIEPAHDILIPGYARGSDTSGPCRARQKSKPNSRSLPLDCFYNRAFPPLACCIDSVYPGPRWGRDTTRSRDIVGGGRGGSGDDNDMAVPAESQDAPSKVVNGNVRTGFDTLPLIETSPSNLSCDERHRVNGRLTMVCTAGCGAAALLTSMMPTERPVSESLPLVRGGGRGGGILALQSFRRVRTRT